MESLIAASVSVYDLTLKPNRKIKNEPLTTNNSATGMGMKSGE